MQNLESVEMTLLFARDREASLRRATRLTSPSHRHSHVRRWLGRQLVRTGTWLEDRQPMRPARGISETASP
jgi:hypothetical protein